MKSGIGKRALWIVAGLAIAIQFIRPDRSNPPVTREVRWDSEATARIVRSACYDCHSNETEWPWYSSLAPASWLVAQDVLDAREHLNFSTWDRPNHEADEIIQIVEEGEMPMGRYVLLHPQARLDDATRAALVEGLRATLASDPPFRRTRIMTASDVECRPSTSRRRSGPRRTPGRHVGAGPDPDADGCALPGGCSRRPLRGVMTDGTLVGGGATAGAFDVSAQARDHDDAEQVAMTIEVDVRDHAFSPTPLRIPAGRRVTSAVADAGEVQREFIARRGASEGDFGWTRSTESMSREATRGGYPLPLDEDF